MSDPFETLGVEPTFELDLELVAARHRDLSRALHPDRFSGQSAAQRRQALGRAIEVNAAFRVLKDPVQRAEALLVRRGVAVGEEARATVEPALLMEVMEQREALLEARQAGDRAAVERISRQVRARESEACRTLAEGFAADEPAASSSILKSLGALRYYRRFLEEAALAEDDLG